MRVHRLGAICWGAALLAPSAPAHAEDAPVTVVWYRGSPECPAGAAFLAKLGARANRARLADAGDHIDFIVTLVATPAESVGRLERQTRTGTVAIRELRDARCENVADALALSLGLSLDPNPEQPAPEALPEAPASESVPAPSSTARADAVIAPADAPPPQVAVPARDRGTHAERPSRWSAGAAGGLLMGISPEPMALGAAFVDYDARFRFAPDFSIRAALIGAWGSGDTAIGPVSRTLVAGRGEACPFRWGAGGWGLRPCVSIELGATTASSERQTKELGAGLWVAPGLGLRGTVDIASPVALELQAAGVVPLPRREVDASSRGLYRDAPVVFAGTVGLFVRL